MTPQKEEEVIIHGIMEDYGKVVAATPKAYLIKLGINEEGFWIPASICDFEVSEPLRVLDGSLRTTLNAQGPPAGGAVSIC